VSKENDNGIFEIAAIAALLFLLWKAFRNVKLTTGEPVTTAPEFMDQFKGDPMNCQNIIYKPLMSSMEPVAATFMGKGWCQKGDGSFFDGKEVAYGDKYADEQAQEWNEQKQTEAIQNINRKYVHFRLINTGATPITTKAFDTTQDQTIFSPPTITGVVQFNNNAYISLSSVPDVEGSKVIKFSLYLDSASGIRSVLLYFSNNISDNLRIQVESGQMTISPGKLPLSGKVYDISSFYGIIINGEIHKSTGSIDSLYINEILQTPVSTVLSNSEQITAYIGRDQFTSTYINNCSIWDIEIVGQNKWLGRPDGNTDGAWVDQIGSINGTFIGTANTRNL